MSSTSEATSSLRRNAPAKPMSDSARSRESMGQSRSGSSIAVMIVVRVGAFSCGAVPWVRLMPLLTGWTSGDSAGVGGLPSGGSHSGRRGGGRASRPRVPVGAAASA